MTNPETWRDEFCQFIELLLSTWRDEAWKGDDGVPALQGREDRVSGGYTSYQAVS